MNWIPKDPLSKIDIKYKLPLGFITLYLLVFGIGGYFVVNSVYSPLNREILLRLQSESLAQATLFDKKLETLARRAEDFASDGFIRTKTAEWLSRQAGASKQAEEVRRQLRTHLRVNKLPLVGEFVDLQIYDLAKHRIVGVLGNARDLRKSIEPAFQENRQQFTAIIPPDSVERFPTTAIVTPLWDIDRKSQIGYLVSIINLLSVIQNASVPHDTAMSETHMEKYLTLVDQTGASVEVPWWYLKRLGSRDQMTADDAMAGIKIIPASQSIVPSLHVGRHACQNGKDMYGQSHPLRSLGWTTLIELNAEDALAPLRVLEGKLLGITLVVAITALLMLFFPIQYLVRPLGELQRMAFRIKEGDFSVRNDIDSEDEIGHLAKTFNLMTQAVEDRTRTLEQTAADLEKRERELRVQHNRLNTVVHSMTDGLILLNQAGEIVLSNKAAEPIIRMLEHGENHQSIRKCALHAAASNQCIRCLTDTSRTTTCEVTVEDKIFEVIATKLPSLDGGSAKVLVARDITARERMNERQAHQERLAVLGKTAAVVAHEMNNPLAAISMYNQMMETELPQGSPFREHVEVIQRNTLTCQRIIRELLDYARTPEPKVEQIDLHQMLVDVIRFLRPLNKGKNIRIEQDFQAKKSTFWGDATQIQQVFVNLLHNAMQAVDARNGVIRISTTATRSADRLTIDVVDNGPGIDPRHADEIFEPFFTTKSSGGTGLGLPTARRIVKAHGGELVLLKSHRGVTVFRVVLPCSGNGQPGATA